MTSSSIALRYTPAGQEDTSERDFFIQTYRAEVQAGTPAQDAFKEAKVKLEQFKETKAEARNDGLDSAQASVVANKVTQEGKDYMTAVEETTGKSAIELKIRAGAIKLEQWAVENWLMVTIGAVLALATIVFLLFTKTGKQVTKAITGAPIKRS